MENVQFDVLIRVEMTHPSLLLLIRALRQSSAITSVNLLTENNVNVKGMFTDWKIPVRSYS